MAFYIFLPTLSLYFLITVLFSTSIMAHLQRVLQDCPQLKDLQLKVHCCGFQCLEHHNRFFCLCAIGACMALYLTEPDSTLWSSALARVHNSLWVMPLLYSCVLVAARARHGFREMYFHRLQTQQLEVTCAPLFSIIISIQQV